MGGSQPAEAVASVSRPAEETDWVPERLKSEVRCMFGVGRHRGKRPGKAKMVLRTQCERTQAAQVIYCTLILRTHQVHANTQLAVAQPNLAHPIPPAHSVAQSVRALNTILTQLSGKEALAALKAGNACANVNVGLWSPAWEGARNFRDQFLLTLARATRDEWRRDVSEIVASQPEFNRASLVAKALDSRLRITLDFAFRYLTPRHLCLLGDALMLALEAEMAPSEIARELAASASRSPNATPSLLSALVLGASGMHRYQPERVLASGLSDDGRF